MVSSTSDPVTLCLTGQHDPIVQESLTTVSSRSPQVSQPTMARLAQLMMIDSLPAARDTFPAHPVLSQGRICEEPTRVCCDKSGCLQGIRSMPSLQDF
ncbi:hypothetical protein RRG08_020234 [Elysia crispata]|uniref:Uncharacterized protein n=1 Tax=Elysia crispata TaxID=231223 RepID=A0AAE1A1X4_9GAST|nr:hypothetical protein RRG08_020234 [Elysia crispata]